VLGSDITKDISVGHMILNGAIRYVSAFDPVYWFTYRFNPGEVRHLWKDRSFIPMILSVPFFIGLMYSLMTIRSITSRSVLVFLLAGPLPVFFVETHVQRIFYIIPAFVLITSIGVNFVFGLIRGSFIRLLFASLFLTGIVYDSAMLLREAEGALLWYSDYGIRGLQWGAQAIFRDAIPRLLSEDSSIRIVPSSYWANGPESFPEFFLDESQRNRLVIRSFDVFHSREVMRIPPEFVFVLDPTERMMVENSPRFRRLSPILEVPYPDGSRGFTFTRIEYVDNIDEVIAQQRLYHHPKKSS
jgi:hypothetical protein